MFQTINLQKPSYVPSRENMWLGIVDLKVTDWQQHDWRIKIICTFFQNDTLLLIDPAHEIPGQNETLANRN